MAFKPVTPVAVHPPFSSYNHGMLVPAGTDLLFCSGQLGVSPEGHIPESAEDQAVMCFENIREILKEAGLGFSDIIRINAFVTSHQAFQDYMKVRNRYIAEPYPASTLVIVCGFTRPEFCVEVEVVAGRPPSEQGSFHAPLDPEPDRNPERGR